MRSEHGTIEGDLRLPESLQLHGFVTGAVTVPGNTTLVLHGLVGKHLVVERGGEAIIHGMVNGDVSNDGGVVSVYGMINGAVHNQSGTTVLYPKAVVKGAVVGNVTRLEG
ncbi:MAG: polymer-forming cytoskeletal protein [Vicinamibacterales bacterium]|jgi:cytoskeletal protein CcmA (bactofilin family)